VRVEPGPRIAIRGRWVDLDAGSSLIWDLNRNLEFQGIAR